MNSPYILNNILSQKVNHLSERRNEERGVVDQIKHDHWDERTYPQGGDEGEEKDGDEAEGDS
jgi:hypothetical protein